MAVLAHARDPGNAGTVLRTADAAGADAVLLTGDSVDPYNAQVRAGHAPAACSTCRWPSGATRSRTLPALRAAGLRVLAADGHADLDLDDATDQGLLAGPTAWVFGNEAWGLPAGDPRAGRRRRQGPDPRPGREPQPGHRRRGLPLRVRPGARARTHDER